MFSIAHIYLVMFIIRASWSFIAYDCSMTQVNYTKLDINRVQPCSSNPVTTINHDILIQLLQIQDEIPVPTISCKILITRLVTHCGFGSHSSQVPKGFSSYIMNIGRDKCQSLIDMLPTVLTPPSSNPVTMTMPSSQSSIQHSWTLAGKVENNGDCSGVYYTDPLGSWDKVIVTGYISIQVMSHNSQAHLESDVIHLPNHMTCSYSKAFCESMMNGETYWKIRPLDSCNSARHIVLYEGKGVRVSPQKDASSWKNQIVTVDTETIIFSLRLRATYKLCGQDAYTTEHPKLIIVNGKSTGFLLSPKQLQPFNLDLMLYMNSKFVFLERHIATNLELLYNSIMTTKCDIEYNLLKSKLILAATHPDEFAYLHSGEPGYTGSLLGEVIFISKCQAVDVSLRQTPECYHELPVAYNNRSFFMTPRSHLLQQHGTQITCNSLFSPMYFLEGTWYSIRNGIHESPSPVTMTPDKQLQWAYKSTHSLATSGLYTQGELDTLRDHLMYGQEIKAIQGILTRGYTGQDYNSQGGSLLNMINEDGIKTLGKRIYEKMWSWFSILGNISAGLIGLLMILKIVKWCIDTIIHGTALYEVFGWSFKLICAVWDSATWFLIHRLKRATPSSEDTEASIIPLTASDTESPPTTTLYPSLGFQNAPK